MLEGNFAVGWLLQLADGISCANSMHLYKHLAAKGSEPFGGR